MFGKIQESGLNEMIPLIYILAIQGQYPIFLHSEFPSRCTIRGQLHRLMSSQSQYSVFTEMAGNIFLSRRLTLTLHNIKTLTQNGTQKEIFANVG